METTAVNVSKIEIASLSQPYLVGAVSNKISIISGSGFHVSLSFVVNMVVRGW